MTTPIRLIGPTIFLLAALLAPRPLIAATGCTYPTTLDTFVDVSPSDDLTAANYNKLQCAIEKTEAELGTNPKGSYATVVARLNDAVYSARAINTGTGLSGGGNLSADRTLSIDSTVATLSGSQTLSNKTLDNTSTINVKDTLLRIQDNADTSKQAGFEASGIATATTRTYTLPNSDGTIVLESRSITTGTGLTGGGDFSSNRTHSIDSTVATLTGTQTLDNKTLGNSTIATIKDGNLSIVDDADVTKIAKFQASGITTATTRTYTLPNSDGTLVLESRSITTGTGLTGGGDFSTNRAHSIDATVATLSGTQTLTNKTLDNTNIFTIRDDRFTLQDNLDTTKQAAFQLSSIATGTTRTYTLPNASGIVVLESASVTNAGVVLNGSGSGLETTSGLSIRRDCITDQIPKWSGTAWNCAADAASAGVTKGSFGSRGQRSKNNATTPTTKFDLIADAVILRNSSNDVIVHYNPSTITNDITLTNGSDNGRDQAGAFSASSWIHFYWVSDGTTLKSRSSITAPPTGPALQGAETHWSYAGAVRLNVSSNLLLIRIIGNLAFYDEDTISTTRVLTAGVATAFTSVSANGFVPPNALTMVLQLTSSIVHNAAGVGFAGFLRTTGTSPTNGNAFLVNVVSQVAGIQASGTSSGFVANVSQAVDYRIAVVPSTSGGISLDVLGYTLPNGG